MELLQQKTKASNKVVMLYKTPRKFKVVFYYAPKLGEKALQISRSFANYDLALNYFNK